MPNDVPTFKTDRNAAAVLELIDAGDIDRARDFVVGRNFLPRHKRMINQRANRLWGVGPIFKL